MPKVRYIVIFIWLITLSVAIFIDNDPKPVNMTKVIKIQATTTTEPSSGITCIVNGNIVHTGPAEAKTICK